MRGLQSHHDHIRFLLLVLLDNGGGGSSDRVSNGVAAACISHGLLGTADHRLARIGTARVLVSADGVLALDSLVELKFVS